MCAMEGGRVGGGWTDAAEQETISHSRVQQREEALGWGGVDRRRRGQYTVMAGWGTSGDECVIHPSLLPAEQHVQDMRSERPKTREHECHYCPQQGEHDAGDLQDKQHRVCQEEDRQEGERTKSIHNFNKGEPTNDVCLQFIFNGLTLCLSR